MNERKKERKKERSKNKTYGMSLKKKNENKEREEISKWINK